MEKPVSDALERLTLHSAGYEDGTRWCDFCHVPVYGRSQPDKGKILSVHLPDCPIRVVLEGLESRNVQR